MKNDRLWIYFLYGLSPLFAPASTSQAACHAVGPAVTGTGSGADWNNVMKLPSAPVRGDKYYLKDGSYGTYNPTTATSGTTVIVIKKAQSYDFGRASDGCTNDISAGWNASTMGASQAVFTGAGGVFSTNGGQGYYTLDGNGKTTTAGCGGAPSVNAAASDCGIKLAASGTSASTYGVLWLNGNYDNGATRATGWIVRYVEMVGAGDAGNSVANSNEHTFFCRNGCNNLLFEHNYLHESACDFIDTPYGDTVVFNRNYFKQNASQANCHGQFYLGDGTGMNNYTFSNNVMQDIEGTAVWSVLNGGHANNWAILNNVVTNTPGSKRGGISTGFFSCINSGSQCTNINIIGNTFANAKSDYNGSYRIADDTGGSNSVTLRNNLFYSIVNGQDETTSGAIGDIQFSNATHDHNSFLNSGSVQMSGGTGDVTVQSAPNPFVNWTSYNFTLATQNADWENGTVLTAPYNVDALDNARPGSDGQWDRGAYEFGSSVTPPPPPSSNACDLNNDGSVNSADVQSSVNQALGVTACTTANLQQNGQCNAIDVQRVVNAVLGGSCVTGQ